ncbi:DUF1905 domain-containing protein [Lagierella sp.]|uniref:DUF1905 domain-containing protein n=1 Tax=Lagierella sp. TaxID=2849657 RepID=UPI00261A96C9|nr:DUF1905 domain-containing protein [Lagierella sp.]
MNTKLYKFKAKLHLIPEKGGAYVIFPYDIKSEFGKGRVKVHATFNGVPYDGSVVNMGIKDEKGEVCYILGVLKSIRQALNVGEGDILEVTVQERE